MFFFRFCQIPTKCLREKAWPGYVEKVEVFFLQNSLQEKVFLSVQNIVQKMCTNDPKSSKNMFYGTFRKKT